MKIKRINIERYGPLENLDLELKSGINVIYGSNESGKSLTMDFLLKKLAKKRLAKDKRLKRVQEDPEGFIVFYDDKEIKLERNQYLTDFLPSVKDEDICKIFVMRDSDLNLPDDKYYENITDRLTGLRTDDIDKLSKGLLNHGCLTPKLREIAKKTDYGNLKEKLKKAKKLKDKIVIYIRDNEDIYGLEGEIFNIKMQMDQIQIFLDEQKRAKLKDDYNRNKKAIDIIQSSNEELEKLPKKNSLDNLKGKIEEYYQNKVIIAKYTKMSNFSKWNILASLLFCLLFWIVWLVTNQPFIGIFTPIVTTVFLIASMLIWFIAFKKIRNYEKIVDELIDISKEIGLKYNDIDEIQIVLKAKFEQIEEAENNIMENIGALKRALDINDNHRDIDEVAEQILIEMESTIDHKLRVKYKPKKQKDFETNYKKLDSKIKSFGEKLQKHKEKLYSFSQELLGLNIDRILNEDFNLAVENIDSLLVLVEKLKLYIFTIENRAEICRNALEIFDEIEKEEKTKISHLFDKNSICVNFFNEITGGNYIDITFNSKESKIIVKKSNGDELSADKLSEGTYDQLYLAIRVDLAQRILSENNGFLIMDDIFLSYDTKRLKEGIKILKKLSDLGWQIIYFTAKEKECELFKKVTKNDIIKLKPL